MNYALVIAVFFSLPLIILSKEVYARANVDSKYKNREKNYVREKICVKATNVQPHDLKKDTEYPATS